MERSEHDDRHGLTAGAITLEMVCPRHGRVAAAVSHRTGATGPPCPDCGGACAIYAPALALARACAEAVPRLGFARLLEVLRQDAGAYPSPLAPRRTDAATDERYAATAATEMPEPAPPSGVVSG